MQAPGINQWALCKVCQTNPRNGRHPFCSKRCAAQAATLCEQCHAKPKYGNHDFCGKHCASLATGANQPQSGGQGIGGLFSQVVGHIKGTNQHPSPGGNQPQYVVVSPIGGSGLNHQQASTHPMAAPQLVMVQSPNSNGGAQHSSSGLGRNKTSFKLPTAMRNVKAPAPVSSLPICRLPGCQKPVYVENGMIASDHCSKGHAMQDVNHANPMPSRPMPSRQAVAAPSSGYDTDSDDGQDIGAQPWQDVCILCLKAPQRDSDYFCNETCRTRAMKK